MPGGRASVDASPAAGVAWMMLAIGLLSLMDALAKALSARYPIFELVFFRAALSLPVLLPFLLREGGIRALRSRRPLLQLGRAVAGVTAVTLFFYAVALMPLADAVILGFSAPLMVTALSVPLLREPVGPRRWIAVLIGFIGVAVTVQPGSGLFSPIALLPLGAALAYAFIAIFTRQLTASDGNASIVFWTAIAAMVAGGLSLPFDGVWPALSDWPLLALLGLLGALGQLAMTQAFRLAPVSVIAPFEYSGILWAVGLGWLWFGELPPGSAYAGAAIIAASGLYILRRETRRRKA